MNAEIFQIAPAGSNSMWGLLIVPAAILLLVTGVLGAALSGARASSVEVSSDGLRLRGDLYGRLIPMRALTVDGARRVDFGHDPDLEPVRRQMGTGLPGYRSGWFRLRNGERALLYLTDRSRAVYVPTTDGYGVLLSPADPEGFLLSLRRAAGAR